jgi:hypothetical protein
MRTTVRRLSISLLIAPLVATLCAIAPPRAAATTAAAPPTPTGLPTAIEPLANYVGQSACDPHTRAGTAQLAALLVKTYPGTTTNTVYSCATDGATSEHYEGRAIDWMVSARTVTGLANATAMLSWLLATDKSGDRFAMARRLGLMYVIFNNRIWGDWDQKWDPYQDCATRTSTAYDSYCHRNHVHISLGWNGAMARTSFWSKRVSTTTDFGPCRPRDLNWASRYVSANLVGCPSYATVVAPTGASTLKKTLVRYSGARVGLNSHGPIVLAVQQALHVAGAAGDFGPITLAAVLAFQKTRGLPQSGLMDQASWRAVLAVTK